MKLSLSKMLTVLLVLMFEFITGHAQSPSFQTYMNPVIPGDHPDATLTRIGNDFYTTGSSFNVTPVIYHSTDLVHWEAIAQPVKASWSNYDDRPGGGCWGGQMVFYKGLYWDYFSRANTMYFVTANDPRGPWSNPVKVNNPSSLNYGLGYDNSVFIDNDGKWYLVVKNGQPNNGIVELGDDGQPTGVVYNLSWLNPAPDYPYSWAEGPVMWKYNGYYYYSFARDLSGGQKVMRSDTLTADQGSWEMLGDFFDENDPLKNTSKFTSPNHASAAVIIDDSTSWVIHPLYAKGEWKGQGRQGLLNQVRYNQNDKPTADYPVNKYFTAPKLPDNGIPWMVPKSDFFDSDKLNPEWSFLGYTPDNTHSLSDRPGWLHLSAKSTNVPNTVIKNDGEHNYSLITRLDFHASATNDQAGLQIMRGDEKSFVKLYSSVNDSNQKVVVFSFNSTKYETPNTAGDTLLLRIFRSNHNVSGYFSNNGYDWTKVGNTFDISTIDSYSDYSTFTGTRQGLYVSGSSAYFDYYIYRDAYSPILAECPANQFGTIADGKKDGIYQLDSISNNDWALYAGVEFGNKEYPKAPHSVEFTAACGGTGGTVEVWLDSINGKKIAECPISGTGDWSTFKTFSCPVTNTKGMHDVYLRFKGGSGRLFILKWIKFVSQVPPAFVSANAVESETVLLKLDGPVLGPSLPSGLSIETNGTTDIPISGISLAPNDSGMLVITLSAPILNTDKITASYTPGAIVNEDSVSIFPFSKVFVGNLLPGSIPRIESVETKDKGDTVWLSLNKKMSSPAFYAADFTIGIKGKASIPVTTAGLMTGDSSVLVLLPENRIYYEDTVSLTYSGTGVEAANGGALENFSDLPVINTTEGYPPQIVDAVIMGDSTGYNNIDLLLDRPLLNSGIEKDSFLITLNDEPVTIESVTVHYDTLIFLFSPSVRYGDEIKISYSGGNIRSYYNGFLQAFSDYVVTNTLEPSGLIKLSENKNSPLTAYPNPAHDKLHISRSTPFNSLSIYNSLAQLMLQKSFSHPVNDIILQVNLNPGTYFILLKNNRTSEAGKIIIR
jgi:xylan 1,4-beta-xylosidase